MDSSGRKLTVPFYGAIGLVSAIVLALQILQSRIFSVTTWYHLSFLVISIGMFGLTLGAMKVYKDDEEAIRKDWPRRTARYCTALAIAIVISLGVQLYVPLVHEDIKKTLVLLPIVALFSGIPSYLAGVVISISLTRTPYPVARTYAADLVGAALGCIGVFLLMNALDAPTAILTLAFVSILAAKLYLVAGGDSSATEQRRLSLFGIVFVGLILFNSFHPSKPFSIRWVKAVYEPESNYERVFWNPISRVTVGKELTGGPFLWGRATKNTVKAEVNLKLLTIDGSAGTPLTKFDGTSLSELSYLSDDVTNIAQIFSKGAKVAIIGVGGGRDVLSAYYFGASAVTAIDINAVQIRLLTEDPSLREYTNLNSLPSAQFVLDEARSWFARNQEQKFDLIQMSLIDTWAATAAGAFALSENTLYTTQAWKIFLDDLEDDGIFTVSRWYTQGASLDSARLLSLAQTTLWELGVENPREHIVMIRSERISTLLISKSPFPQERLDALLSHADSKGFVVQVSPSGGEDQGLLKTLFDFNDIETQRAYTNSLRFDLSAPTDWRPFFFNQTKFDHPIVLAKYIFSISGTNGLLPGHIHATMNLIVINVFSIVVVLFILILPQISTTSGVDRGTLVWGSLYFLLIGLGFMFYEIALLQIFGIFLGHPTYSLTVTLFSLVLFTGLGSLLSDFVRLTTLSKSVAWCTLTCGYGVLLLFFLDYSLLNFIESSFFVRVLICVLSLMPLGLLLGYGFPTGIARIQQLDSKLTPWLWAVNGASGVLGSSLAITLNIALGLKFTIGLGAVCYGLLALPLVKISQAVAAAKR